MSDIGFDGLDSLIGFLALAALSFFAILIFAFLGWKKRKTGKNVFFRYAGAAIIPFCVGVAGCLAIDFLPLEMKKLLDSWGMICILIVSILLGILWGIRKCKQGN